VLGASISSLAVLRQAPALNLEKKAYLVSYLRPSNASFPARCSCVPWEPVPRNSFNSMTIPSN